MRSQRAAVAATLLAIVACSDAPTATSAGRTLTTRPVEDDAPQTTSSVRWNRKANALFRARGGNAGRINAYLAVAQYRAVRSAAGRGYGAVRPYLAGAAAGASATVLEQLYPLDAKDMEIELLMQRWTGPSENRSSDFDAGVATGREVGATVLAFAATDNFGRMTPSSPPTGARYWTSSDAPMGSGGLGARPFFLASGNELRSFLPSPPAFGSAPYLAALAEVRALSDGRTAAQVAIAQKWVPFSTVVLNGVATDLIEKYHRSELEAARILAYANAAAFDAIVACFETKFTYWLIRPSQADAAITLAVALPNHPSYPSEHSCETGAFESVLEDAFPSERAMLAEIAEEVSVSRVYAGIHYRFDGEAGLVLGRQVGRLALQRRGLDYQVIW
jgi:membrane-associated phospholipid phosphatase